MIFIDANIFLAYANEDDIHHDRAVKILTTVINDKKYGPLFTSDYVFNEVVGVTFRKVGKREAIILGEHMRKTVFILAIDDHLLKEAWKLFADTHTKLNLVDCSNLAVMKLAKTGFIATFDREFLQISGITVIA